LIYLKQINDINSITWSGSDLIDSYTFEEVMKSYSIYLDIPDFDFSNRTSQIYEKIIKNYNSWVNQGLTFGIKIMVIDNSGDSIDQTFIFQNNENC